MLHTLVHLELTDDWQHMIDSTIVRGHSQAAGVKGGPSKRALIEARRLYEQKTTPAATVRDALLAQLEHLVRNASGTMGRKSLICRAVTAD
jgi:hypothetical protein